VKEQSLINEVLPRVQKELTEKYPDAQIISKRFLLGPGEGGSVQVRFSGENYNILRPLAAQAMEILRADGGAKGIRIDSREPEKVDVADEMSKSCRRSVHSFPKCKHA
jgi:multidrug efflux pump subunit AcrB